MTGLATTGLLLRADADGRIGAGHAMRCLALGQAWIARGGRVTLASVGLPETIARRCAEAGIAVAALPAADPRALSAVASACGAKVALIDAPHLGIKALHALRGAGLAIAVMDDEAARPEYYCDLIVNPNLHADPAAYARLARGVRALCGTAYVVLRPEFADPPSAPRVIDGPARSLLVTLGGADPQRLTERLAAELVAQGVTERGRVVVVVGPANPRAEAVRAALAGRGEVVVDAPAMRPLMEAADLAITSGGGAVWEMAFTGLPALIGAVAPMEVRLGEAVAAVGAGRMLGRFEDTAPARVVAAAEALAQDVWTLASLSARAQALVDGRGAARVAQALAELVRDERGAAA